MCYIFFFSKSKLLGFVSLLLTDILNIKFLIVFGPLHNPHFIPSIMYTSTKFLSLKEWAFLVTFHRQSSMASSLLNHRSKSLWMASQVLQTLLQLTVPILPSSCRTLSLTLWHCAYPPGCLFLEQALWAGIRVWASWCPSPHLYLRTFSSLTLWLTLHCPQDLPPPSVKWMVRGRGHSGRFAVLVSGLLLYRIVC